MSKEVKASTGDIAVWKEDGLYIAGIVEGCNLRDIAISAKIPTPDGWRVYPIKGMPRIAKAEGMKGNVDRLVQNAPVFQSLYAVQSYFAPHRHSA